MLCNIQRSQCIEKESDAMQKLSFEVIITFIATYTGPDPTFHINLSIHPLNNIVP